MKKLLYVLIGCVFWANSQAATLWTGFSAVSYVQVNEWGMHFWTGYSNSAVSTCSSGNRWQIKKTHVNYDQVSNVVTAAFLSNNEIRMYLPSTTPRCAPYVTGIMVKKP
jgi:hypothetical protein